MVKKIIQIIVIIFFFSNCASKKTVTEYKDKIVRDTIIKNKTVTKVERYTDTLTINEPCDSLGNLKPFTQLLKVRQGNISIKGVNNVISAQIDLKGYEKILEETYKTKYQKEIEKYKETNIKYKTPLWCWIYIVFSTVIIILLLRFR